MQNTDMRWNCMEKRRKALRGDGLAKRFEAVDMQVDAERGELLRDVMACKGME